MASLAASSHLPSQIFKPLSASHAARLQADGYAIVDDFIDPEWASALRAELVALQELRLLLPNQIELSTAQGPVRVTKPHIFEADMHNTELRSQCPSFNELFESDSLCDDLNAKLPDLELQTGSSAKVVKLQYNGGHGACFPYHFDNPGRPNRRKITCLVYLNPNWAPGDGGELQLRPFLTKESVTVAPLYGRAVLFRSDGVLHRVMPCFKPRCCFTVWLDAEEKAINGDYDIGLRAKHLALGAEACVGTFSEVVNGAAVFGGSIESSMPHPCLGPSAPLQRAVSRNVYASEYAQSIQECFFTPSSYSSSSNGESSTSGKRAGDGSTGSIVKTSGDSRNGKELSGPGRYMVAQHWARVKAVEQSNPDLAAFIQDLRKIKFERENGNSV